MTPHDLLLWDIASHDFWPWCRDGTWKRINNALRSDLHVLEGRNRHPRTASQTVKITDCKQHILADTLDLSTTVIVTGGHIQDRDGSKLL
jgi:putative transposase